MILMKNKLIRNKSTSYSKRRNSWKKEKKRWVVVKELVQKHLELSTKKKNLLPKLSIKMRAPKKESRPSLRIPFFFNFWQMNNLQSWLMLWRRFRLLQDKQLLQKEKKEILCSLLTQDSFNALKLSIKKTLISRLTSQDNSLENLPWCTMLLELPLLNVRYQVKYMHLIDPHLHRSFKSLQQKRESNSWTFFPKSKFYQK